MKTGTEPVKHGRFALPGRGPIEMLRCIKKEAERAFFHVCCQQGVAAAKKVYQEASRKSVFPRPQGRGPIEPNDLTPIS
jgi:hypothetical protein